MPDEPQTSPQTELDAIVERWHAETFAGSPVARDTEIWNFIHKAKDDLKARLAVALAPTNA